MDFVSLVEGPLLKIVFVVFCIGILGRLAFFVTSIVKRERPQQGTGEGVIKIFIRSLLPFHRATPKKPLYASLRYLFHICLFVVPIWFGGHIALWEESGLEWSWVSLPDVWADWMTLILLVLAAIFLLRHMILKEVRRNSSLADYVIIIISAFPFVTGYALTHGTLEEIPF
ncbi:MAG: hypothetical protein JRJ85_09070, partial [Deltaproteobacteria bacterium]|nr:hypothetical protein [Deltaproteobacteria bacterium]